MVEGFETYSGPGCKDLLYPTHRYLFLNFLMSIIWFLTPSSCFFLKSCFYFSIVLLGIFLVWVHFHSFYFILASEGSFDEGYVSNDLCEYTYEDLIDWTILGLILALVEFEGRLFKYLDNWMGLNCIGEGMRKSKKYGGN